MFQFRFDSFDGLVLLDGVARVGLLFVQLFDAVGCNGSEVFLVMAG